MAALFYLLLGIMTAVAAAAVLSAAKAQEPREPINRPPPDSVAPNTGGRWLIFIAAAVLPFAAAGLYWRLGEPQMATQAPPKITAATLQHAVAALQQELREGKAENGSGDNTGRWLLLAKSLAALQRYDEAREVFIRLREISGESAELLIGEAEMAIVENKTKDAAMLLDRALALRPNDGGALWLAGRLAAERGDADAARRYWQRALPLLGEFPAEQAELAAMIAELPAAVVVAHVRLADFVRDQVGDADAVFVFVRTVGADGGPPLAAKRLTVGDLPAVVALSDADAMLPDLKPSAAGPYVVAARVSPSGDARDGNFYSLAAAAVKNATVSIVINQTR